MFKQLPDQCLGVTTQALLLLLSLNALVEEDTVLALLTKSFTNVEVGEKEGFSCIQY